MLTIFSIPKPFLGHIGVIQRNALGSWMRLGEGVQVMLHGNDAGVAEAAREVGAEHISDIEQTEYGTPLLNSAFSTTARKAQNPLLCYVNGDIMFTDDLTRAVASIRKRNFLMVGRRWNVDITDPWDFSDPQWSKKLVTFTRNRGTLYRDDAIDYFVFPRDSRLTILPPFVVGRPGWDNYFLFRCRQLGYPLIDATTVVTAVHQNHDYAHVPNGIGHLWYGPEADANIKLVGDESRLFTLIDATHNLDESGLKKNTDLKYSRRRRSVYLALHPRQKVFVKAVFAMKTVLRRIGLLPRVQVLKSPR
jgi:hypothetical protein